MIPFIDVYEADADGNEALVHRQMTDDEYAQWQTDQAVNAINKASAAISSNEAYLALSPPTTAQALAQVTALTRQMNAVIRLMVKLLAQAS